MDERDNRGNSQIPEGWMQARNELKYLRYKSINISLLNGGAWLNFPLEELMEKPFFAI